MILHPHCRKKKQCVMNHWLSTSISRKHHPENPTGEVDRPERKRRAVGWGAQRSSKRGARGPHPTPARQRLADPPRSGEG